MERIFFRYDTTRKDLIIVHAECDSYESFTGHQIDILRIISSCKEIDREDLFLFESKRFPSHNSPTIEEDIWLLDYEAILPNKISGFFEVDGEYFYKVKNISSEYRMIF